MALIKPNESRACYVANARLVLSILFRVEVVLPPILLGSSFEMLSMFVSGVWVLLTLLFEEAVFTNENIGRLRLLRLFGWAFINTLVFVIAVISQKVLSSEVDSVEGLVKWVVRKDTVYIFLLLFCAIASMRTVGLIIAWVLTRLRTKADGNQ
ncbi:MAG: hypothetical protein WCS99_23025 [Limisphaerales bacterium]